MTAEMMAPAMALRWSRPQVGDGYLETIAPDVLRWLRARVEDGFAPADLVVVVRDRANSADGPLVSVELRARVFPMLADSPEGHRPGVLARIAAELLTCEPDVVPLVWVEPGLHRWAGREVVVASSHLRITSAGVSDAGAR